MCLGTIRRLEHVDGEDGARVGRLEGGSVVSLGFVPDARPGVYVIVHMGVPVEVLRDEDARTALALREEGSS
jgi:hydrogenase expression/formation protein HypC